MKRLALLLVFLASPALAQQAQPDPIAQETQARVATQVGNLLIANTSQEVQIEALKAQIAELQKAVKTAETKTTLSKHGARKP